MKLKTSEWRCDWDESGVGNLGDLECAISSRSDGECDLQSIYRFASISSASLESLWPDLAQKWVKERLFALGV